MNLACNKISKVRYESLIFARIIRNGFLLTVGKVILKVKYNMHLVFLDHDDFMAMSPTHNNQLLDIKFDSWSQLIVRSYFSYCKIKRSICCRLPVSIICTRQILAVFKNWVTSYWYSKRLNVWYPNVWKHMCEFLITL